MHASAFVGQSGFDLPSAGGGEIILWLLLGAGIVGLWLIINRTRKRSYREYMTRAQREEELKRADPDMRNPED